MLPFLGDINQAKERFKPYWGKSIASGERKTTKII